jgi:thioredoxin 1
MATIELTKESFSGVVSGATLVLVDFWGQRCRLCRMFEPVFEEASQRHPDAVFGKVDAETHGQLAAMFRVMSLPTLVIMKEGFVIYARSGALSREDLEDLVGQAYALDMNEVRRKRAARRDTRTGHRSTRRLRDPDRQKVVYAAMASVVMPRWWKRVCMLMRRVS